MEFYADRGDSVATLRQLRAKVRIRFRVPLRHMDLFGILLPIQNAFGQDWFDVYVRGLAYIYIINHQNVYVLGPDVG